MYVRWLPLESRRHARDDLSTFAFPRFTVSTFESGSVWWFVGFEIGIAVVILNAHQISGMKLLLKDLNWVRGLVLDVALSQGIECLLHHVSYQVTYSKMLSSSIWQYLL